MTFRRHSILVPNTVGAAGKHALVFYDWGDVTAPRITICVHGLTRNAHDFDLLAEALAATGRRVFSLSMAGRGESAWLEDPAGYNYASYVADCLAVMDNFHLRGVEWVGTSMGGIIGMMLAAQHEGRIKKLVLNDIGIHLSGATLKRIFTYINLMPKSFPNRAAADLFFQAIYQPFGITDPVLWAKLVDDSLFVTEDGAYHIACDPRIVEPARAMTQNFTQVEDVNLTAFWEKILIPALIIRGAESDLLSAETVQAMRIANPRADTVTIPGVGHAPPLMAPEQIALVVNWLNRPSTALGGGL